MTTTRRLAGRTLRPCLLLFVLAGCSVLPVPTLPPPPASAAGSPPPAPPWPAPADPAPGIIAAGITADASEQLASHTHTHLDVFYDGVPVEVPGGIGIDPNGKYISPLHTHSTSGVIHMEAAASRTFTLGQIFQEWGVSLTGAVAYDRGETVTDVAGHVLQNNHEVAVVFGRPPARIPTDYGRWVCLWLYLCN